MKDEMETIGILREEGSYNSKQELIFGHLDTVKEGKKVRFRAYRSKKGLPMFLGSSLKPLSDEEIKAKEDKLMVGKIGKNLVVFMPADWEWD